MDVASFGKNISEKPYYYATGFFDPYTTLFVANKCFVELWQPWKCLTFFVWYFLNQQNRLEQDIYRSKIEPLLK